MKKLSLLLFVTIYLFGSLFFVREDAKAATKVVLTLKGKKTSIHKKTVAVHVGEKDAVLSYLVNGKRKKIKGSWSSSNKKIVKVDKNGRCHALNNGTSTIKFTYKVKGNNQSVYCKLKVYTRPVEVELADETNGMDSSIMKPNQSKIFKVKLIPSDEALDVKSNIKSNYKVFYELFSNEECTQKTDLGTVDSDGFVLSKEFGGVMYLRAMAKRDVNSKNFVYSNVKKIVIEGMTAEEKRLEEERQKKEKEEEREREKLRPVRIEIEENAPLQSALATNHLLYAKIYFRLYDGNGKELTHDLATKASDFTVKWEDSNLSVLENGSATVTLVTNIPNRPQNIGTVGKVTVTYSEPAGKEITATKQVRIAPPALITKAEVKGIYRYVFDKTSNSYKYENVLDGNSVRIKKGDKITGSGNYIYLNQFPGSYYLLIDVMDSYNKIVSEMGIKDSAFKILINGKTGIVIDDTVGLMGVKEKQSIKPIVIDGRPYLTFPLKEATVEAGEIQIILQGGYVRKDFLKMISDGTIMVSFFLNGTVAGTGELAEVGKENSLEYTLFNSKGENIKDYDQVLYHLKMTDIFKSGLIQLPSNSEMISSSKGSLFKIRKNPTNNQAEIIYTPMINLLISGNPLYPISDFGQDEITLLRGFGRDLERKVTINVRKSK